MLLIPVLNPTSVLFALFVFFGQISVSFAKLRILVHVETRNVFKKTNGVRLKKEENITQG